MAGNKAREVKDCVIKQRGKVVKKEFILYKKLLFQPSTQGKKLANCDNNIYIFNFHNDISNIPSSQQVRPW